eukprot:TRINITY_DN5389_c0_g1_i1.p1 TRINITY_DN5389_c0_g1~~TRINITY_DN5389_c0_g1_i1.p1  ORF type:complete len:230 (-),score=43.62 TRINITY_DN5389_c0_g1_i1:22-711(-)
MKSGKEKKVGLFKVAVLGDSGVGKTALLHRYVKAQFIEGYKTTIGADFMTKDVLVDNKLFVTLQLWDTAGQERYQALGGPYYRGADGCILVFDLTRPQTFNHLNKWKDEFILQTRCAHTKFSVPFLVIGNKSDIEGKEKREMLSNKAKEWCDIQNQKGSGGDAQVKFEYYEISAKEGTNIEQAFSVLAKHVYGSSINEQLPLDELQPNLSVMTDKEYQTSWCAGYSCQK